MNTNKMKVIGHTKYGPPEVEATKYVETGQQTGNVVLTVAQNAQFQT